MKLKFLGGAGEIGRIAIYVKTRKTKLLLDYGVMLNHEPGFPMHVPPKDVDAIILTHAHLDHSGAIPIFHISDNIPVYGNDLTFELAHVLLSDFIHLSGYYIPFEYIDVQSMLKSCIHKNYNEEFKIKGAKLKFLNAGHIPGSLQVLIEAERKRILYTGDINTIDTRLLKAAEKDYGELDALIIESTYADQDHPDRIELEKYFISRVREVVEGGGVALIPAFALGRCQEIICILRAYNFEYPVIVDGMAREINRILVRYLEYLRKPDLFLEAVRNVRIIRGKKERKRILREPCVIVSPAGMLKGGPSAFYARRIANDERSAIFLVSFQIPGTPGRELLETGRFPVNSGVKKVKAQVEHFDFSSHAGMSGLHQLIRELKGDPDVYVVHGAEGNCAKLAKWIKEEVGLKALAPRAGGTHTV